MQTSNSTARPSTVRPQIAYDGRGFGLEWSGGRLAQVFEGGIRLWERASWKVLKEIPIQPVIAFGTLADDSLLAVAKSAEEEEVVHIPTVGEPRHFRAHWLSSRRHHELLPNRASPRQFLLLDPDRRGAALWELPQKGGLVREVKNISLEVPDYDSVVVLGDGSLVYNGTGGLHRIGPIPPRGLPPRRILAWPVRSAGILARGPNEHQLWAADQRGDVSLVEIADQGESRIERVLKVPGQIYQLESAKDAVAVLRVDPPVPGEEKWTLVVLDEQGKQRMTATLPSEPPAVPLATPPRNRCLRLTDEYVAVGGQTELTVWQISNGRVVHHHTASPSP